MLPPLRPEYSTDYLLACLKVLLGRQIRDKVSIDRALLLASDNLFDFEISQDFETQEIILKLVNK